MQDVRIGVEGRELVSLLHEVIHHTNRHPKSLSWLCCKLLCSEKELRAAVTAGKKEGFSVDITGPFVFTKLAIGTGPLIVLGDIKPGRKHIGHVTDTHTGSKHFHKKGLRATLHDFRRRGITTIAFTGDGTDGVKPLLVPDQRLTGADDQIEELVDAFSPFAFDVFAIPGNHDGYSSAAIGSDMGKLIEERMRAAGVNWHNGGTCVGNGVLHGARTHLWHPMGAASTPNAIRRMMNARAETLAEPTDLMLLGHLHHHASCYAAAEDIFCSSGGTFQLKKSEFANRISRPWDVGASIISFTLDKRGKASEFSVKFFPIAQAS